MKNEPANTVKKIIGWIEDHLEDDLTLEVIAERAGYSPYYFSRMFLAHTRRTVMEYVRGRRLVRGAKRLLNEPGLRLVDLAFDCGFDSQEAFTRAFKRMFGTTPARFREGFAVEPMEGQYPMTATAETQNVVQRLPELFERDRFVVAGPARRFDETNKDEIPQPWSRLMGALPMKGQVKWTTYGVVSGIDRDERTLSYMAGVEVNENAVLPEGFERLVVEPATYAVFRLTFDGGPVHLQIAEGIRQVWGHLMPESGLMPTGKPDFECYNDRKPLTEPGATMDYYVPVQSGALRELDNAPPGCPSGAFCLAGSVAVAADRSRPDEAVALAVLILDQVGVDRSGEARIVELEAQIVAAFVGLLGPGGADFYAADEDPVTGSVFAARARIGNDTDLFGLK
ncbi:hypothetical protein CHELA40_30287 [Chelatococcus asaccharovorans]|nr:hypothetical protein CHELA17_40128 [Chelatococcus asaccharovorans]CAH1688725.1 hypothetical protein CHELA40_30287 [Chelatococcus asaccharovorans]